MSDSKNQIKGLVQLLDDPDEQIYEHVKTQFETIGMDAIPLLEEYWEDSNNSLAVERAYDLIQYITSREVIDQLNTWLQLGGKNLLKGAIIIAKAAYPNLEEEKVTAQFNQIKQDIWIELNDSLTALEKIAVVNKVLFDIHGFEGNRENYYAPRNSFINKVIESKTGTPLSIGIIYSIICQGLDIPVYGVNLPHHFVLAYQDEQFAALMEDHLAEPGILFYINPFNNGSVFGKPEVNDFLIQNEIKPEKKFFVPCSNKDIIKRMINNVIVAYKKKEKNEIVERFENLLALFSPAKS